VAHFFISRRTFCTQLCLAAGAACPLVRAVAPPQSEPVPIPRDRADDTYAVLSLLIASLETTKKEYLVPDSTEDPDRQFGAGRPVTSRKQLMFAGAGSIVAVPEDRLPQFNEGIADVAARKGQRVNLEPRFSLPLRYRMMNSEARAEYQKLIPPAVEPADGPWRLDHEIVRKYKGRGPLSLFSQVYFDRGQTLGMVWAMTYGNCSEGWHIYEKRDNTWRLVPWKIAESCVSA